MATLARKIHKNHLKLVKAYIREHPELEKFVSILKRAADIEHNVNVKISVGKAVNEDNAFWSYLTSYMNNPRILLTAADNKPMVLISGKSYTFTSICLSDMRDLRICADVDYTGNPFDRYNIRFTLDNPIVRSIDYDMNIVIDKCFEHKK